MIKDIPNGVYPTMITPYTADNKIDYNAVEKLINWYDEKGVAGIFAICQSSEIFFLSLEERLELLKFIVKNELVATYGIKVSVVSGFGAKTLNVAQQPSIFSTLNTLEQVTPSSPHTTFSRVVGILHGVPLPQHVYNITGLVLQFNVVAPHPKNPRSHVSKQVSLQLAFCCNILITVSISAMHLHDSFSVLLLHI